MDELNLIAQWAGWPVVAATMLVGGGYAIWLLNNRIENLKEINEQLEKRLSRGSAGEKPIKHYILFWWRGENDWAVGDWNAAQSYIAKFGSTCGFSRYEAANAEMVTIVGAASGTDERAEEFLEDAGCKVERLDGSSQEDTVALLKERVRANKAFIGGRHRRG